MGSLASDSRIGKEHFGSNVRESPKLLAGWKGIHGREIQEGQKICDMPSRS